MYPQICTIGPFTIYSYGLALAVAFVACSWLATLRAKVENINPELIFNFCFFVLIFGIIGARIFYILNNLGFYLKNPLEIIMLQHGGLIWYGGLISGIISAAFYIKKHKLSFYKIVDLITPFAALGQAIGRVGCLLNGCCFGKTLIPIQIYASFFLLVIFLILRNLQERPHKPGQIFFTYLLLYSFKRFFIEFWRIDSPIILGGLTLFQLISLCIFFISLLKLKSLARKE